jgi:hypothetical protein
MATKVTLADLAKRLDAQNETIAELKDQVAALTAEPKKKPAAKPKTKTIKVTVSGGAGAGSSEEEKPKPKKNDEMSEIEKMEHKIKLSEKYIADESKPEDNRRKRAKQLETERAQLRKLNVDEDEEEKVPVELSIKELQDLTLKLKLDASTTPGVYTDSDGRVVTGPPADSDEEFSEIDFEGETYDVGDNTKRVYRQYPGAAANPDREKLFVGYPGVATLRKMKIAEDE